MKIVAQFLHEACQIAIDIQKESGKKMRDFRPAAAKHPGIEPLRKKVVEFAKKFPIPGKMLD